MLRQHLKHREGDQRSLVKVSVTQQVLKLLGERMPRFVKTKDIVAELQLNKHTVWQALRSLLRNDLVMKAAAIREKGDRGRHPTMWRLK